MYVKKCDKVAQENVGTDSIKLFSFLCLFRTPYLGLSIITQCHMLCRDYFSNSIFCF